MVGFAIACPILFGIGWMLSGVMKQPGSPEVRAGQRILYQMMGPTTLEKAGFYETYPDADPSDFVAFVQSNKGSILWPDTVGGGANDRKSQIIETASNRSNRIPKPKDLTFSPRERQPGMDPQLVFIPNDEKGRMILKAFDPGDDEPEFVYEWPFPTDAGEIPLR